MIEPATDFRQSRLVETSVDQPGDGPDLLLPERAVLLHIGPHKTGTTALQGALHRARPQLRAHGIEYAGRERQHQQAALAVTGGLGLAGDPIPDPRRWDRLVEQVNAETERRVVVSSEFFNGADEETARDIVESLGGDRVHILVTLRPLAKILPSAWQQHVRNRLEVGYDEWLDGLFNQPPYDWPTKSFWRRHRHDSLVERWAGVVGTDRLTVVMVDERDRDGLMRTVEELLGAPNGLLEPDDHVNRSLTYAETEAIRQLNIALHGRSWPGRRYKDVVRMGMIQNLQLGYQPTPDEARIRTPRWALERAARIGSDAAKRIADSGVRVVGDLSALGALPESEDDNCDAPTLSVPATVAAIAGAIEAGEKREEAATKRANKPQPRPKPDLNRVRGTELVGALIGRLKRRVARVARRRSPAG